MPRPCFRAVSLSRLLAAELRGTLFGEGGHALFLVFGGEERVEETALEQHTLGQRRLISRDEECKYERSFDILLLLECWVSTS